MLFLKKMTLKFCLVEPGYYEDGKFGVRIENLVLVVKAETKVRMGLLLYKVTAKQPQLNISSW